MNKIELGSVVKPASIITVHLALVSLTACGGGTKANSEQEVLPTATLEPTSSPPPNFTATPRYVQIKNPFTEVVYTIDENGCAIIPAGGTAYGAATVLGNPSNPLDISPLQFVESNGTKLKPVSSPNQLPSLAHPGDKVCPVNNSSTPTPAASIKGSRNLASIPTGFHPDVKASKPVQVFRRRG